MRSSQAVLSFTLSTAFVFPTRPFPWAGTRSPPALQGFVGNPKTERNMTNEETTCGNALDYRAGGGPAVPFRLRRHGRNSRPGQHGNTSSVEHPDAHAIAHTHAHTHVDTHTNASTYADTNPDAHADTDAYADTDTNTNTYAYADTYADTYTDADTDAYAHAYANAYTDTNAYTHTDAHAGETCFVHRPDQIGG